MTDDVRVPLREMSQAWSDIQGYTSNMWQISALCLTVVALSINTFASSLGLANPPPSWTWQIVFLLALIFVIVTIYTIQWLRSSIVKRVAYILRTEETIARISSRNSVVSASDLFNVTEGPMKVLLYFFYMLSLGLSSLIAYPMLEMLANAQLTLIDIVNLLSIIFGITSILILLLRDFRILRIRERLIGETAELTSEDNQIDELHPLRIAYTNTILKRVFKENWDDVDISVWYNSDKTPWKILTYSINLPESIRELEIPFLPFFEFTLSKEKYEWLYTPKDLVKAYPLLSEFSQLLFKGTRDGIGFFKVRQYDFPVIIREVGIYGTKAVEIDSLAKELKTLFDEFGDIFSEFDIPQLKES